MDPHPSSKSTNAPASISKIAGVTLTIQELVSFANNSKANAEREVTVNKMTAPAAGIMTENSSLVCLPSTLQEVMDKNDGLDLLPSLYAELLFLFVGSNASLPQKLRMIHGVIAKLRGTLVTLSTNDNCWPNLHRSQDFVGPARASPRLSISGSEH